MVFTLGGGGDRYLLPDFNCGLREGVGEGDLPEEASHKGRQPGLQVVRLFPRQVPVNIV